MQDALILDSLILSFAFSLRYCYAKLWLDVGR